MTTRALVTFSRVLLGAMAAVACWPAPAAEPAADRPQPWVVANSQDRLMRSADGQHEYRIFAATVGPVPAAGYPAIYILDANSSFGTLLDEARRQQDATYKASVLVVGVGYPGEVPWHDLQRTFDLTPKVAPGVVPRGPGGQPLPPTGGADHFLDFILNTLRPAIERDFKVDRTRQTLAGHSFGGLFTLHTYLTRNDSFQRYVAMSPSIWFADGHILGEIPQLEHRVRSGHEPAPLLITVGGCEQTFGECDPAMPRTPVRQQWLETQTRMIDRARDLQARVNGIRDAGLGVELQVIEGEHHISVIAPSVSRVVRFALGN